MYEEKDNRFNLSLTRSKSRKYLFLNPKVNEFSSEYLLLPANSPEAKFTIFQARADQFQYEIEHIGDRFYVLTDWNAPNFRLMETPENRHHKRELERGDPS